MSGSGSSDRYVAGHGSTLDTFLVLKGDNLSDVNFFFSLRGALTERELCHVKETVCSMRSKYHIYSDIRQSFPLSRMTTNN